MLRYYLFELLRFIVRFIPLRLAYRIAAGLSAVTYLFSRRSKANYRANLAHILSFQGEDPRSPSGQRKIKALTRQNFRNFSYYLIDFFRFSRFDLPQLKALVEVEGRHNLQRAFQPKRGVIGVTAHVGNWELGGMVLSLLGYPVHAIALSHQNTKINRLFVNQRALAGMSVIPVGRAVLKSLRALKKNQMVVILGDRDVTERGVEVEFFGSPAHIPRGPAALAVRSGAEIFFGYFVRISFDRYRVVLRPPLSVDRSRPRPEQEEELIKKLVKEMEECIMANLSQWYMYYPIWEA